MRNNNLTLNLSKCEFGKGEIKFVGYIVGSGKIKMDPDKIKAIMDFKKPETKKEVKQLLGLFGFYRVFLPMFAELARPLTDLTKKDVCNIVNWTDEHENVLEKLKQLVCPSQVLTNFEFGRVTNLYCDSSDYAVGAVLTQVKENDY